MVFWGGKIEKTPPFYLWEKRGRKDQETMRCRIGHEPILILLAPSPLMCYRIPAEKWSPRLQECEKVVVGHTSGPGGPGNPTGPLSPTFPCRNQKNMGKSELASGCRVSCLEQHPPAKLSFQLGKEPLGRETKKQRVLGYLPGGLLSLVPQGPQANPGCPERDTFFQNTMRHQKNTNSPGSSFTAEREASPKGWT